MSRGERTLLGIATWIGALFAFILIGHVAACEQDETVCVTRN